MFNLFVKLKIIVLTLQAMGKKKLLKQLRRAARELPNAYRKVNVRKDGTEILQINPEAKTNTGEAIDPKGKYLADAPQKINHYRAMKKLAGKHGAMAAVSYFSAVQKMAKAKKENGK